MSGEVTKVKCSLKPSAMSGTETSSHELSARTASSHLCVYNRYIFSQNESIASYHDQYDAAYNYGTDNRSTVWSDVCLTVHH